MPPSTEPAFDSCQITSSGEQNNAVVEGQTATIDFAFLNLNEAVSLPAQSQPSQSNFSGFLFNLSEFYSNSNQQQDVTLSQLEINGTPAPAWTSRYSSSSGMVLVYPEDATQLALTSDVTVSLNTASITTTQSSAYIGAGIVVPADDNKPRMFKSGFAVQKQAGGNNNLFQSLLPSNRPNYLYSPKIPGPNAGNSEPTILQFFFENVTTQTLVVTNEEDALFTVFFPAVSGTQSGYGVISTENQIENSFQVSVSTLAYPANSSWNRTSDTNSNGVVYSISLPSAASLKLSSLEQLTIEVSNATTPFPPGESFVSFNFPKVGTVSGGTVFAASCWNTPVEKMYAPMAISALTASPFQVQGGYATVTGPSDTNSTLGWQVNNATQTEIVGQGPQPLIKTGLPVQVNRSQTYILLAYDQTCGDVQSAAYTVTAAPDWEEETLPIGIILAWSGDASELDTSVWSVCNGEHGTPDLRNLFIVGSGMRAGSDTSLSIGDSESAPSAAHTHSSPEGYALSATVSSAGGHSHRIQANGYRCSSNTWFCTGTSAFLASDEMIPETATTSSSGQHTHTFEPKNLSGITTASQTGATVLIPPYYALYYIMKTGNG